MNNSNVVKGILVGGDAWFESIESCVKLKRVHGLNLTFIIKQNLNYFPIKLIHAILSSRFGTHPAGHWMVVQTTIDGVDLYVMAYA